MFRPNCSLNIEDFSEQIYKERGGKEVIVQNQCSLIYVHDSENLEFQQVKSLSEVCHIFSSYLF